MMIWAILFVKGVIGAVIIRQPFSEYVGSQSEGFAYSLSDYFVGPNLNYSLSSASSSQWNSTFNNPFTFSLDSQASFDESTAAASLSNSRKLRSYTDSSNATCILSYYSNNLTSYRIQDNSLNLQWSILIDNSADDVFINDIAVSPDNAFLYAVLSYSTDRTTFVSAVYIAYDFLEGAPTFSMVSGFTLSPQQAIRIEVSSLYAAVLNSTSSSLSSAGTLSVYNITDPANPSNVTVVPSTNNAADLAFYNAGTLIVADTQQGLLKYYLDNNTVTLLSQLTQPDISSIDISGSFGIVALDSSVLLVDIDAMVVDEIVNLYSSNGTARATAVSGKMIGEVGFVNSYTDSSNVAIVDFDLLPDQGLVKNWNLAAVQTDDFDPYGPYQVFLNPDGSYAYVRIDNSITSLASLTTGEWTFSGFTDSQNFTANITAFIGSNTLINATLAFTGTSISPDSVVSFSNNSFFTATVPLELETSAVYFELVTPLYASQYFGGSYQTYNLSLEAVLGVEVGYELPSKTIKTSVAASNATAVSGGEGYYVLTDGQTVTAYSFTGGNSTVLYSYNASADLNLTAPITAALWVNDCIVSYSSQAQYLQRACAGSIEALPNMNCVTLKASFGYVFCGNSANVTVLNLSSDYSSEVAFINASSLGLPALNVSDITFSSATSGSAAQNCLVLADATGLLSVPLDQLGLATYTYYGPTGNTTSLSQAFTTEDQIIIAYTDGSVAVYSANYKSAPTLSRQLAGRGSLLSASSASGVLSLQYADLVDVVDLYADGLSALYTKFPSSPCPSAAVSADYCYVLTLCQLTSYVDLTSTSTLSAYQIQGTRSEPRSALKYAVLLSLNATAPYFDTVMTVATGNITAYNEYASATVPFTLQVSNKSPYVVSSFNQPSFTCKYDNSTTIPVLDYFLGQDLTFQVNVNGGYVAYEYNDFTYSPLVLRPKVELKSNYSEVNLTGLDQGVNVTAVITESQVFVVDSALIGLYHYTNFSSYCINAHSVSLLELGNKTYSAFIICGLTSDTTSSRYSVTFSPSNKTELLYAGTSPYSFVKAVPLSSLSAFVYYVTPCRDSQGDFIETRFTGSYFYYYNDKASLQSDTPEYSFADFGIDSLSVAAIDSYYVDVNNVYVYMADATSGIRVFNVTHDPSTQLTTQDLVSSIDTNSYPVSIGVCGDWLFVGSLNEQVYQYSLADPAAPVFNQSFYTTGNFTGVSGNINCNADFMPTYAVVPLLSNSGSFTARVLSLQANSSSAIYADLTYGSYSTGTSYFAYGATVRTLAGGALVDNKLSVPQLYVQPMTAAQYASVLEEYGTDVYDVFITASNDYVSFNSSTFTLVRSGVPDNDDNDDDDDSASAMWLSLLAGALVLG
jgi:hypothetical protein